MSNNQLNVLIIGATSAIAQATARLYARKNPRMILVARDQDKMKAVADDLQTRGADVVETITADLTDFSRHDEILSSAFDRLGGLDLCLIAHGVLGNQEEAESNYDVADRVFRVNFLSVASLLTRLANLLEKQGWGHIVAISSVAGDRGRKSNYVYGASKAALDAFCQGLRNRLYPKGIKVLTVKPGFVDTPMTADLKKSPLFAKPKAIGQGIVKAVEKNKNEVYLPFFWRLIMAIIKAIPESIFKRLNL